jgi:hypothetical protein
MITAMPVYEEAHRLLGVDLSAVPGISGGVVCMLISELGKAEGDVVGAHKPARIVWAMIVHRQPYDEQKAFKTSAASTAKRIKNLQNQAQTLGFKLVPA